MGGDENGKKGKTLDRVVIKWMAQSPGIPACQLKHGEWKYALRLHPWQDEGVGCM
jgi:hypothetical protein